MDGSNEEDLLWVLDRQKENYLEIKKQARRYLLGVISITIVLVGLIVQFGLPVISEESAISYSIEHGILWQLDLLGAQYASAFVESFFMVPVIIITIGVWFFMLGMRIAYEIEKESRYQPFGNVGTVLEEKPWEVREWIEKNDELISSLDKARFKAMEFAQIGIYVTLGGILLIGTLYGLIIIFFFVLVWTLVNIFIAFHTEDSIEGSNFQRVFGSILIITVGSRPMAFLQELTVDPLPSIALNLGFSFLVAIAVLYFTYGDTIYDYIAN